MHFAGNNIDNSCQLFKNESPLNVSEMAPVLPLQITIRFRRKQNSGNAPSHSVHNLLSSRLPSKNVKIRIYESIVLPAVLYGCETWSLSLREEVKVKITL
jgi:hypothetical protein